MRIFKLKRKDNSPGLMISGPPGKLKNEKQAIRQKEKEEFAENLRNNPTESELIFHGLLMDMGIKFEYQPVICGYIPDFYFPAHGFKIIEVDGSSHLGRERQDRHRDGVLNKHGYRVLHLRASRMFWDLPRIKLEVRAFLSGRQTSRKQWKKAKKCRPPKLPPNELLRDFFFMTKGI